MGPTRAVARGCNARPRGASAPNRRAEAAAQNWEMRPVAARVQPGCGAGAGAKARTCSHSRVCFAMALEAATALEGAPL